MPSDHTSKKSRMRSLMERESIGGQKQQDLPFEEIVAHVSGFLVAQEELRAAIAFGNEVGEELEDDGDTRFDPLALLDEYPEQIEQIAQYVEHEMDTNEAELLDRKSNSIFAYNTLVFGAALRIHRSKKLSPELREFLVDHLIFPEPPTEPKGRGRPTVKNDEVQFKLNAIEFALKHGLKAVRNDATPERNSACDAVSQAALSIYQSQGNKRFATGYSFDNLKKVWSENKTNKLWVEKPDFTTHATLPKDC